jgi:hypothetical protein
VVESKNTLHDVFVGVGKAKRSEGGQRARLVTSIGRRERASTEEVAGKDKGPVATHKQHSQGGDPKAEGSEGRGGGHQVDQEEVSGTSQVEAEEGGRVEDVTSRSDLIGGRTRTRAEPGFKFQEEGRKRVID